jgi:hypothetical protein
MKNLSILVVLLFAITFFITGCQESPNPVSQDNNTQTTLNKGGFDEFGYNYQSRLFNGPADGVDRVLDGKVWGDLTYAKDKLVMKWSKVWDDARFNGAPWTPDAWEDNEWNGAFPGGSGAVWHSKIIWIGPLLENSPYWRDGGYAIWGEFEVIMDQGKDPNYGPGHLWYAHANPTGYGSH